MVFTREKKQTDRDDCAGYQVTTCCRRFWQSLMASWWRAEIWAWRSPWTSWICIEFLQMFSLVEVVHGEPPCGRSHSCANLSRSVSSDVGNLTCRTQTHVVRMQHIWTLKIGFESRRRTLRLLAPRRRCGWLRR